MTITAFQLDSAPYPAFAGAAHVRVHHDFRAAAFVTFYRESFVCFIYQFLVFVHNFIWLSLLMPNKSPEPMRGIAVSSASRLDVIWSRMAHRPSLGHFAAIQVMSIDIAIPHPIASAVLSSSCSHKDIPVVAMRLPTSSQTSGITRRWR